MSISAGIGGVAAFRTGLAALAVVMGVGVGATGAEPEVVAVPPTIKPASEVTLDDGVDRWRGEVTLWLWLFGISGDIAKGNVSAEIDADIGDIMEASDSIFAFSGRLEVAHDRIGGFIDGMYSDVGVDDATGPIGLGDVEVSMEISAIDFGLMYRAAQWNHPASARDGALDVYAGGRWFSGTVGLSPALVPSQSGDRSWVDPIIGVKIRQPLSEHFHVATWGDIGGFGVESDLTWSATVVLGWDFEMFNLASTLYGGYRAIGWDYSDDSPTFVWDVVLHGPTLGLRISF